MVILGDSNIGKTSLVTRFAEGYYREASRPATVSPHFFTKRIGCNNDHHHNVPTKIQIWDTAGADSFRAMAPMFYKNAAAVIVCYDATDPQSFEGMRMWLDEVRRKVNVGTDVVLAIAALKTDLLDDSNTHTQMAVPEYEVKQLAEALGVIYLPTSAKTNMNVNALFQCVSDRVLEYRTNNNNTLVSMGQQHQNGNCLLNRDDLSSSARSKPRVRDQYDKYYNNDNSNGNTMDNNYYNDDNTSRTRSNSGGGKMKQQPNNDRATPSTAGTSSDENGGHDDGANSLTPERSKRRGKRDKTKHNDDKNINNNDPSSYNTVNTDEMCNTNTCVPMCGVGVDGSSSCIVQ